MLELDLIVQCLNNLLKGSLTEFCSPQILLLLHRGVYGRAGLGASGGSLQVPVPFLAEPLFPSLCLQVSVVLQ